MSRFALGLSLVLCVGAFAFYPDPPPSANGNDLRCTMTFDLSTWSAPGRPSEGSGVVNCASGAMLRVRIVATGAHLHDATSMVDAASGTFTGVRSVAEVLGVYTDADIARAASNDAQILSKGGVMLALSGGNKDIDLAAGMGEFVLTHGPADTTSLP